MVNLLNELGSRELRELVSDGLFAILRESAKSLPDQLCSLFDIQAVLDHLLWDNRHVERFPSKNILVCLEKGDEGAFLFVTEPCPNQCRLGLIGQVEHDLLDILVGADPRLSCFLCWNLPLLLEGGGGEPNGIPLGFCLYALR